MPTSMQASITRRKFSVPARCPAMRGRPRASAQRPLPSMIMAIWVGIFSGRSVFSGSVIASLEFESHLQDLLFFTLACGVDLLDETFCDFLKLFLALLQVVFGDHLFLLELT